MSPEPLVTAAHLVWLAPVAGLLVIWQLGCAAGLIIGRRVPAAVVFAPIALVLAVAAGRVIWTGAQLPWDLATLGGDDRIQAALPDVRARVLLGPLLLPALGVAAIGGAMAAPLRGPRSLWPAGLALLFQGLALLSLSVGALLDLAPVGGGAVALGLVPLGLVVVLAQIRGRPDSSGPEAGLIAAVALGHAVAAVAIGTLAEARFVGVASPLTPDPAGWRAAGALFAWLAAVGITATACTGITTDRGRTIGGVLGAATLLLWIPIALFGSLARLT